jgi:hypothetical protein
MAPTLGGARQGECGESDTPEDVTIPRQRDAIEIPSCFALLRLLLPPELGKGHCIILATATPATAAVQRQTRMIPVVFVGVGDPVAR